MSLHSMSKSGHASDSLLMSAVGDGGRNSAQFLNSFLSFAQYDDVFSKEDELAHDVTHVDDEYEDDREETPSSRGVTAARSSQSDLLESHNASSPRVGEEGPKARKLPRESSMSLLYRRRSLTRTQEGTRRQSAARMSKVGSMGVLISSPGPHVSSPRKSLSSAGRIQSQNHETGTPIPSKAQSKMFQKLLSNYGNSSALNAFTSSLYQLYWGISSLTAFLHSTLFLSP